MLKVQQLHKVFRQRSSSTEAIHDLNFEIGEGELVSLCGPSGCGKTTLLRCMSGLDRPTSGAVLLEERPVDGPPAELAVVFQDYSRSLLPWMSVRENVVFPLRYKKLVRGERSELVAEALDSVGLNGFERHYPWQLSGGMQQRVAIARALAYQPRILLMDEPFASVDAQTRADLEDLVLRVREAYSVTIAFVTHDVDEAVYVSDRVIVLGPRPSVVAEVVAIDLPRPRDQVGTKELPEFAHLRSHVFSAIKRRERTPEHVASERSAG